MMNTIIVFKKELMDTVKNKAILIQFILMPLMTFILENTVAFDGMTEHFFAKLFSVMYIGMAPLTTTASIIAEEKEQNTLRVLQMSNVKASEYLTGVCMYVWIMCMIGAGVIAAVAGFKGSELMCYMMFMALGTLISALFGAAVGVSARNQMSATSIAMPMMMVFSFLPMISMFNDKIGKFAKFVFTGQINSAINSLSYATIKTDDWLVIAVNGIIAVVFFIAVYGRKGLE